MVWAAVVVALLALVLLIIFILQNQHPARVLFLGLDGTVAMGVALLIAAVGGGILVAAAGAARIVQLRSNARRNRAADTMAGSGSGRSRRTWVHAAPRAAGRPRRHRVTIRAGRIMDTTSEHPEGLPSTSGDLSGPGDPLRVVGVVLSALPSEALTPGGHQRYTVTASLSRRPDPLEVESIHGEATQRELEEAGFGHAGLQIADRRLLIFGTNLEELRDGLARVVGGIVRTATLKVLAEKELARQARADLDEAERERFLRVARAAAAIDFES